jgi:putative transposase
MIKALKESHPVKILYQVFYIHRSSYKYWAGRSQIINVRQTEEHALVKSIFNESNGSAGASIKGN